MNVKEQFRKKCYRTLFRITSLILAIGFLLHSNGLEVMASDGNNLIVRTGDRSPIVSLIILLVVALLGIILLIKLRGEE